MDRIFCAFLWLASLALAIWRNAVEPETEYPATFTYLLLLMAAGSCLGIFLARNSFIVGVRSARQARQRQHIALLFAVAVTSILANFHSLSGLSIWFDEDRQALGSRWGGILTNAAIQQQPPLDFLLTAGGIRAFGHTALGLRFHTALLSVLSALLFTALLRRLSLRVATAAWASALFVTNTWLIRYAQEGRPYALAVFCGLLCLHAMLRIFREDDNWRGAAGLILASIMFLLSIGMQPAMYLAAAGLAILPLWRQHRRAVLAALGALATALVIAFPLFYLPVPASAYYLATSPLAGLYSVDWASLAESVRTVASLCAPFLALTALSIFTLFAFPAVRPTNRSPEDRFRTGSLLVASLMLLFFLCFVAAAFLVLIRWKQHERYYLSALPLVILILALTVDMLYEGTHRLGPRLNRAFAALLVCLLPLCLWLQWNASTNPYSQAYKGEDWQTVFSTFRQQAQTNDIAFILTSTPPDVWSPSGFVAAHFYLEDDMEEKIRLIPEWHTAGRTQPEILTELLTRSGGSEPANAFVVTPVWWNRLPLPERALRRQPWIASIPLSNLQFFRITSAGNMLDSLNRFFEIVDKELPECEEKYRLIEMRMEIHRLNKNMPAARECFSRLNALNRNGRLQSEVDRCVALLNER